jgi:hypothetical protein
LGLHSHRHSCIRFIANRFEKRQYKIYTTPKPPSTHSSFLKRIPESQSAQCHLHTRKTTHFVYSSSSSCTPFPLLDPCTGAAVVVVGPVNVAVDAVASGEETSATFFFGSIPIFAVPPEDQHVLTRRTKGVRGARTQINLSRWGDARRAHVRRRAARQMGRRARSAIPRVELVRFVVVARRGERGRGRGGGRGVDVYSVGRRVAFYTRVVSKVSGKTGRGHGPNVSVGCHRL